MKRIYSIPIRAAAFVLSLFAIFSSAPTFAFTCDREVRGPLKFEVSSIPAVEVEDRIYSAPFVVENASDKTISIRAQFTTLDTVYLYDESGKEVAAPNGLERTFEVGPNSKYESTVDFAVRGAYRDAHYPIRSVFVFELDGKTETVDLRPVFATKLISLPQKSKSMKIVDLGANKYLKMTDLSEYAAYWRQDGGDFNPLSVGWSGSVPTSKTSFNYCETTRGGISRAAWSVHPPYAGGPGVVGVRYAVALPNAKSLQLRFFRAMRDVVPPEPPTDGVVYRIFATPIPADADAESLLRRANAAGRVDGRFRRSRRANDLAQADVDLSKFAGQTILLTFETDPGVKRDTTCDGSFWGDVAILADPPTDALLTPEERETLRKINAETFADFTKSNPQGATPTCGVPLEYASKSGVGIGPIKIYESPTSVVPSTGFTFGDGQFAVVTPGKNGVCDGYVTIGSAKKNVQIDGVRAKIQGANVGFERPLAPLDVSVRCVDANVLISETEKFADENRDGNALCCFVSQTTGGLAFRWAASRPNEIERLEFGPFSQKAPRVYFGHGYCVVDPKAFEQSGDGFACSTSHVAFDFANGISVLQATTRPVDRLVVDPDKNIYTLSTRPDSQLTLRSSEKGAFDCAKQYAPGFDKIAAPLVPKKAGRFVFDYRGDSYANILDRVKLFVDYGLTDSLLIQHVWQRYGYDVRLPDIWPPRSEQGTLADLQATQEFCDANDIPFGLHDNYIDFYPDADGFNYDDIIMNPDGQPQKAWFNPGPDAQSYRFKPTSILPFAKRNLETIKKDLKLTAYFTDVFSSIYIMDFRDRDGAFHSRAETLDCWNRYFDLVRKVFDGNAITVSESGNDALIGHLDGADAILRRLTKRQENYTAVLDCADYEYVPWFDAVNHRRFVLHGVGYSDRYQGGLSRDLRGIESDDYLSSEALTGHALMSDLGTSPRGTIRKYWLMQNLARSLAMDEIVGFEFVDGDIHRQKITWKSGVVVRVNRGETDWTIGTFPNSKEPLVLPRCGFWATNENADENAGKNYGGIVRVGSQVAELRVDGESYFVDGRQKLSVEAVPIEPYLNGDAEILDAATLRLPLAWKAASSTDQPYSPFLHLEKPKTWWHDEPKLFVLPLGAPKKPSNEWRGDETDLFPETVALPKDLESGVYDLSVGLYDPKSGRRLTLLGNGTSDKRYRLGSIVVEGNGENRKLSFVAAPPRDSLNDRLIPNASSTDFGVCETSGAFRCEQASERIAKLTPLPDEPKFDVRLTTPFFASGTFDVVLRDRQGKELARRETTAANGATSLTLDSTEAFLYEIVKK